jgi:hypothetical protein
MKGLPQLTKKQKTIAIGAAIVIIISIYILSKKKGGGSSSAKTKAARIAEEEFNKWNSGGVKLKEGNATTMGQLRRYWKEGAGVNNSDKYYISQPWSAAFISWVLKQSGAGDEFKYAPAHSVYIAESVKNRKQNNDKKFKGYKPREVSVEVGDLVCYPRQGGVTYDSPAGYISHCDLVTDVTNGVATVIGGNVSDSVSKKKYTLKDGKIDSSKNKDVFVVIKNSL